MTSEKQIQANRRNSQSSTWPRTTVGKLNVSRNSVKHGLLSKDIVIKNENESKFVKFRQSLYLELAPVGRYETHIDRTLYKALHELQRLQAVHLGRKVSAPLAIDVSVSRDDL